MNSEQISKFLEENKNKMIALFSTYQYIEMMLFMMLYPQSILTPERKQEEFEELNQVINSKTLGKLRWKYSEMYPNDDHHLLPLFEPVIKQRNSFAHGFVIYLSLLRDEEVHETGKLILDDFDKNAVALFEAVRKAKFDSVDIKAPN